MNKGLKTKIEEIEEEKGRFIKTQDECGYAIYDKDIKIIIGKLEALKETVEMIEREIKLLRYEIDILKQDILELPPANIELFEMAIKNKNAKIQALEELLN